MAAKVGIRVGSETPASTSRVAAKRTRRRRPDIYLGYGVLVQLGALAVFLLRYLFRHPEHRPNSRPTAPIAPRRSDCGGEFVVNGQTAAHQVGYQPQARGVGLSEIGRIDVLGSFLKRFGVLG